ncbi:hypothetical protein F5J12DRAFT_785210 [Pisolithus orientalis]|uniref:uncharacterized protein n=1 Tax=Pisolithus orientalis TaxID=936130 RepID=UPI002224942D|nr:uncharacterized protein F5J12DRAFT_785210 [Pisolithus orientalis]KAI5997271.1 hypothetical protein F5J12DRAFT_785210 [Pisolithus orientalis]
MDCIASYMKARFQEEAYCHPINIRNNRDGKTCNAEAAERYAKVTEPSILVTDSNTIHIWYLLDALSPKRRANIWNCLHLLREPLQESIKASPQAWQMDKSYFHDNAELKGAPSTCHLHGFNRVMGWPQNGFLEASWLLKSRMENTSTREWVNQMSDTNALLSAILHVIHPQIYADGREALIHLGEQVEQWADSDMSSILPIWSSTYSSMQLVTTGINGQDPWYDMLVTMGNYPPLDFVIPMLNLQLHYNPGTIIAFSGSALEHGVGAVDSDRACLVNYMHANTSCNWRTVDLKLQNLMQDLDMLALELQTGGVAKILQMGGCFNIIDWAGTQS